MRDLKSQEVARIEKAQDDLCRPRPHLGWNRQAGSLMLERATVSKRLHSLLFAACGG